MLLRNKFQKIKMGIWSVPLFTSHPELKVDLGWIRPKNKCGELAGCLFKFSNEDFETGRVVKLGEFMSAICDTAKIYGYLDIRALENWQDFMNRVAEFNPRTESFQLHFFCTDEQIPFYFEYREGRCIMREFQAYHCAFFDWKREGPIFNRKNYVKRYSKAGGGNHRPFKAMIESLSRSPFGLLGF